MKLHGIVVTKNEGDIIGYMLRQAAAWADRIYVFDTGSTDGTWAEVCRLARELPAIVPYKAEARPFDDALRSEVFRAFQHEASEDSWWCRLDSDEIYAADPRLFLAPVPRSHHLVWAAHAQFYFTEKDAARFPSTGAALPVIDESNRPRYYVTNASEPRFFRHRRRLRWDGGAWPRHVGLVHPARIPLRHLQYRSPQQIQLRLNTRREAAAAGYAHFGHSLQERWEDQIRDSAAYHFDDGKSPLVIDEHLMPRHLESFPQRLVKRVLHGSGIWP